MKVLHVYKAYPPVHGGIENHLRTLALGLNRRDGLDVEVLVAGRDRRTTREIDEGVPITRAGRQLELRDADRGHRCDPSGCPVPTG